MENRMKRNIVLFLALLSCFCLGAFAFSATKYDPVNGYPPPIGSLYLTRKNLLFLRQLLN